eukprot:gene17960-23590_t
MSRNTTQYKIFMQVRN